MKFEEINTWLIEFSEKHDLINHALESSINVLMTCLMENPDEGYSLEETKLKFDRQEYMFNNDSEESSFVKTYISLYRTANKESVKYGYYELNTDTTGNNFDDWLVFTE